MMNRWPNFCYNDELFQGLEIQLSSNGINVTISPARRQRLRNPIDHRGRKGEERYVFFIW